MKLKNISPDTYRLMGKYTWYPDETMEVPDAVAAHVLEAQAGRFEVVADDPDESGESSGKKDSNRQQKTGRSRFR